ncbi:MAG: hypothetical protein ACRDN8_03060 [Thermoleophilaceae bacterium]
MSQPPRWTLIVLRAWVDTEGMRVRVLGTDSAGEDTQIVVASPEDAARIVNTWLSDLAAGTRLGSSADQRRKT